MFSTSTSSTRFAALGALAFLLSSAFANPNPAPAPAPQQQVQMGDFVFNVPAFMGNGLAEITSSTTAADDAAPIFEPSSPQILAPSTAARKRSLRKRQTQLALHLCPGALQACTLPSGSYECLDTAGELNACGACVEDGGMDCEAIPHVENVSCAIGRCEVHSCTDGYRPSFDKTSCVPTSTHRRFRRRHQH